MKTVSDLEWGGRTGLAFDFIASGRSGDNETPWVTALISVDQPSTPALGKLSRTEKHLALRTFAEQQRLELLTWIDEHDLTNQVAQISAPSPFGLMTAICTREAVRQLRSAPGVNNITITPDTTIELDIAVLN